MNDETRVAELNKIQKWLTDNGFFQSDPGKYYAKKTPCGYMLSTLFGHPYDKFRMSFVRTGNGGEVLDAERLEDDTADGLLVQFKAKCDAAIYAEDHCPKCGHHWDEHEFAVPAPYCPVPPVQQEGQSEKEAQQQQG